MTDMLLRFSGLPMQRGLAVVRLQAALVVKGAMAPAEIDGLFGPGTARAVKLFQQGIGLSATGIVDALTAGRLGLRDPTPGPQVSRSAGPVAVTPATGPLMAKDMPPAKARRVILHWTGGGTRASSLDRQHYHFLIQQDGSVVRGRYSIKDNDSTADGHYAAHVYGFNTGSVGVALCGMARAREKPFFAGPAPILESQLPVLAQLVAQICQRYRIPVTPQTVLAHGEVTANCRKPQHGKWDPLRLPWMPDESPAAVGNQLRQMVKDAMRPMAAPLGMTADPDRQSFALSICGQEIPGGGFACNGEDWVPLEPLLEPMAWTLVDDPLDLATATLEVDGVLHQVPRRPADPNRVLDLHALAEALGLVLRSDDDGRRQLAAPGLELIAPAGFRTITVQAGDGALSIARRELGDGNLWHQISLPDGTALDAARAGQLIEGETLLVPQDRAPVLATTELPQRIAEAVAQVVDGDLQTEARSHVPLIVEALFGEGIRDPAQIAYVLATAQHESNLGRHMTETWTSSAAQEAYERNRRLNPHPGDGRRYLGRGFVQLTSRANYSRFGVKLGLSLESQPELAADPAHAARILASGMARLGYRSPRLVLGAYAYSDGYDFYRARDIVNNDRDIFEPRYGTGRGLGIAARAERFEAAIHPLL